MTEKQRVPLTKSQKDILREFYGIPNTQVIFDRSKRKKIWADFKRLREVPDIGLEKRCPALLAEIEKSLGSGNLIQSAVFSECVYAQTLANMFGLINFYNFLDYPKSLDQSILNLLDSYHLKPRYVYKDVSGGRILIQAGGSAGVDSALVSVHDKQIFTIEFKEPGAKTSEPDLPAYGEDGQFVVDDGFLAKNPQFETMVSEQIEKGLNFWESIGFNVNEFSLESIQKAISENYAAKKYADVICVEDVNGFLTMIPANQVGIWAVIEGEIRPAGRNSYKVWTPNALKKFIIDYGGRIEDGVVFVPEANMATASKRGGDGSVGRYKLNSLFFVRVEHVNYVGGEVYFSLEKVKQLKPTIAAKMFFKKLLIEEVQNYYSPEIDC